MADLGWHEQLRLARERLGVSRRELARRSGVPADTLRRWEDGSRHPPEARLRTLLDALDCPSAEANAILKSAGFPVRHTLFPEDRFPNYYYAVEELQTAVDDVPWPEFVLNAQRSLRPTSPSRRSGASTTPGRRRIGRLRR